MTCTSNTLLSSALDFLFGCHHNDLSRVFTIRGRTYRVCLDCGAEFKYSLHSMAIQQRDAVVAVAPRPAGDLVRGHVGEVEPC